jgi:hypothetical protein
VYKKEINGRDKGMKQSCVERISVVRLGWICKTNVYGY